MRFNRDTERYVHSVASVQCTPPNTQCKAVSVKVWNPCTRSYDDLVRHLPSISADILIREGTAELAYA